MEKKIRDIISRMTLEEKASMCSGEDFWYLKSVERVGIPKLMVSDGPNGLRTPTIVTKELGFNTKEAVSFPPACLSACSFDETLLRELGEHLGDECRHEKVDVLLGPAANMKRSPLCGRNFEYFSEDPLLGSRLAAAYVKGVQSRGVSSCVKHFMANNARRFRPKWTSAPCERSTWRPSRALCATRSRTP